MNWQQPTTLLIVAITAFALLRKYLKNKDKPNCPANCSCVVVPNTILNSCVPNTHTTLNMLNPGQEGIVTHFTEMLDNARKVRLMEMGIIKGTKIAFIKRSPLKDPIEISINNNHLMIRRTEAQCICVTIL